MSKQSFERILQAKEYWKNKLSGEFNQISIAPDQILTDVNEKRDYQFSLSEKVSQQIIKISDNSDYRIHVCLLSAVSALMFKYNLGADIFLGTPIYGEVKENRINSFIVTKCEFNTSKTFKQLIIELSKDVKKAVEFQNFDLPAYLMQHGIIDRKTGRSLVDVFVSLDSLHSRGTLAGIDPGVLFRFAKNGNHISGIIEYHSSLYSEERIMSVAAQLNLLLEACMDDLNLELTAISLRSEDEIDFSHGLQQPYPENETIVTLFAEQVRLAPEKIAVVFGDQQMTYHQLDQLSSQLAHFLTS
ncbi:hypothetical protein FHW88_006151, partial [Mucilaginibacter sp. SG538B]|uniref:condensation domain-containing protein n=1 Tax=Mucilaginibacter sp. SG538B TaxID=2587021 RepID=UPI00159E7428